MKRRFLSALVLAGLAAGIWLLWFEHSPSTEAANTGNAEQRPQLESEDSRRLFGPGERETATQISARGRDSAAEQANRSTPADVPASKPLQSARVNRAAADFPDYEEPEEFVIGGLVQDEEGNPLSHFEVLAERIDHSDSAAVVYEDVPSIFSDFDGTFLFGNLEDGEYRVRIAPVEGIAPAEASVRAGTLNVSLVVVVLRNVRVYGTVNSTDGTPIKAVHIIAGPPARSTRSGSKGEYELDISRQGNDVVYTILFQHKGFQQQRIRIKPAELDDLTGDFQLDVSMEPLKRLTSVTGRLTDTKGKPVGGETLYIVTSQMRNRYHAQSDVRGNFLFEKVEPGKDYRLRIYSGSGYKNKVINPLLVPDGGLKLDIVLERIEQGELSGWMIDLDGHPIPGFSLTLVSIIAPSQSVSVVGDQQGFFSVEDFPVGGALLRTNSYPRLTVQGIRVSPEPEEPVTVILDIGRHVLQGRVINLFGEPVAATSVALEWGFSDNGLRNFSARKTTADQNGSFVFTGLGPGLHKMQVSAAGFDTAVRTIDVATDPIEIVVELEEETQ